MFTFCLSVSFKKWKIDMEFDECSGGEKIRERKQVLENTVWIYNKKLKNLIKDKEETLNTEKLPKDYDVLGSNFFIAFEFM